MRTRFSRWTRVATLAVSVTFVLSACSSVIAGEPDTGNAPNANLNVRGVDPNSQFDVTAQNALSDIELFWKANFPTVSGGKSLPPIKGGYYSVDGLKIVQTRQPVGPVAKEACARKSVSFLVDNAAYCRLDDSIVWDRVDTHLFAQLAKKYGDFTVALIFAHEFGHAISNRLGVFNSRPATIYTESQADCAAGAWAASAVKGGAPHFRTATLKTLDDALDGFLNGRDSTPVNVDEISHGNGFDRLSAVADGFDKGVTYCYSKSYFGSRIFTERPFRPGEAGATGDNTPFDQVVDTTANNPFVNDLNRFWTAAAKSIGKTFQPVKIASAAHPKCGSSTAKFGYCPDDNTVYFDPVFAEGVYNSIPDVQIDKANGNVTLVSNQPGDFALGAMFSIGWGLAVRHQLFNRTLDDQTALVSALCYTGAYAKNINIPSGSNPAIQLTLSPADLDEGVSATLDQVPKDEAFGARGTTGLDRIQAFIKGYQGTLAVC
ncbi:MAG: neutral zinc metallopeptidase [Actinomycetota bacterium]|nr:neutral zinc metallopeptidase [Actinomycetota bacterium]